MRRGVQEYIKNWVGRPIQEHRPNFRFLYPTIRIFITRDLSGVMVETPNPLQTWKLSVGSIMPCYCYTYCNRTYRYYEYRKDNEIRVIKIKDSTICYKADDHSQECRIKRRHHVSYDLQLNGKSLIVDITSGERKRAKIYEVNPYNCEEGRQLFRKVIRRLDRRLGI